jgi:glucan phosphorylase
MFKQLIKDGYQSEVPDIWLTQGNPWEVKRHDIRFEVGFSGKTASSNGKTVWTPAEKVGRHGWREKHGVVYVCVACACARWWYVKWQVKAGLLQSVRHALFIVA